MSVLYLLTAPPPHMPGTDAIFAEVARLERTFQGETVNLFPLRRPDSRVPRWLYGLHKAGVVPKLERRHRVNHLYFGMLHWFPVLGLLRNPLVYTVAASLEGSNRPGSLTRLRTLHRIVVSNERDAAVLRSWGLSNFEIIPPGIDTSGISARLLPLGSRLTLLMASAPWEPAQFGLKGVDTLLEAAGRLRDVDIILLWRGLFLKELEERIERIGLRERVGIVNRKVDVNQYLQRAHAAILLAKDANVVKAYPNSLVESLAAGKPVLVSNKLPMADFVRRHDCGVVLDEVNATALVAAIETLRRRYEELAQNAAAVRPDTFSIDALIENYRRLYVTAP